MASKDKSKTPNVDLDFSLDLDGFDYGEIDGQADKSSNKKREPVKSAFKGAISGAKSSVMSSAQIDRFIKHALPKEFAETIDNNKKTKETVAGLYNDAIKEIKPNVQKIVREADKLVPNEMKRSKAVLDKLKKAFGVEDSSSSSFKQNSNDEQIQQQLAAVFNVQTEQSTHQHAEMRAEGHIRDKIEAKRFQSSFGLLNSMNINLAKLSGYNEKVNAAYQKKSLELQYRSFFMQKELLETSKRFYEIFKVQNDALVKNSALPDFVKMRKSDIFKDVIQRKFAGSVGSMFSNSQFIQQGVENLKTAGKEKIANFGQSLGDFGEMLSGIGEAKEAMAMVDEMAEQTGSEKQDVVELISEFVTSYGADKAAEMLYKQIGKRIPKKILIQIADIRSKSMNLRRTFKRVRKSKAMEIDYDAKGTLGKLKNTGRGVLGTLMDIFDNQGADLKLKRNTGLKTATEQALFDGRAHKSITKIIPGYLSRIFRELQVIRTGNDSIDLTEYNFKSDRFTSKTKLKKEVAKDLFNKKRHSGYDSKTDDVVKELTGTAELSPEIQAKIKARVKDVGFSNGGGEVEDFLDPKFLKTLPKDVQEMLKKRYDTKSEGYKERETALHNKIDKAQTSIVDVRAEIEALYNAGYEDILRQLGVLKVTRDGASIDMKKYGQLVDKGGDLNEIVAKKAKGGSGNNSRLTTATPTAKQKQTTVKSSTAKAASIQPSAKSKSFSFPSFNGSIQPKVSYTPSALAGGSATAGGGSEQVAILSSIKEDTGKIVDRLGSIGQLAFGLKDFDISSIKEYLKQAKNRFSGKMDEAKEAGDKFSDKIAGLRGQSTTFMGNARNLAVSAAAMVAKTMETVYDKSKVLGGKLKETAGFAKDKAKEAYSKYKDPVMGAAKGIFDKGLELTGTVFNKAREGITDIIQNKLPAGWNKAKEILDFGKEKVKDFLDGPIDIYVKGRETPALRAVLMRAGAYFDQVTGKPIKRPSDIKGPVVNAQGETVLTIEDVEQGIVDSSGNPIRSISVKLMSAVFGAAVKIGSKLKGAINGIMDAGKGFGNRIKGGFNGLLGVGRGSKMIVDVLVQIRDMLNKRLSGKREKFSSVLSPDSGNAKSDSSQDSGASIGSKLKTSAGNALAKVKGIFGGKNKTEGEETDEPGKKKGGVLSSLFGAVKNLTGKLKKDEKKETEGSKKDELGQDGLPKERAGGWQHQMAEMKKKLSGNAKKTLEADKSLRYKNGNVIDKMIGGVASAYEMIKSGLGGLGGVLKEGGGLLGGAGKLGSAALSAGKFVGNVGIGAAKLAGRAAVGIGKGAMTVGRAVGGTVARNGVGGALTAARTGLMATSLMTSGLASAATGAVATIGSVLASPVVIGGAAIALAGFGMYKAYKFMNRNKANKFDTIRLRQYGVGENMASVNHLIFKLEEYLEKEALGFSNGQAKILEKTLDAQKVLDIFDVDPKDDVALKRLVGWFNARFKPVFLKHESAIQAVDGKKSIFEADDLEDDKKEKYVSNIGLPAVYQFMTSPFKDFEQLTAGQTEVQAAIDDARNDWKDNLNKDGTVKQSAFKNGLKSAWNSLFKNDALEAAAKAGGIKGALAKIASYIPGVALAMNAFDGAKKLLTTATSSVAGFITTALSKAMSALEGIRFRLYGIKKGIKFKVSTLRSFEKYLAPMVKMDNNGKASFVGDLTKVMGEVGSIFGVSVGSKNAGEWSKWFNQRFLPVYLAYMGSGTKITGKKEPEKFEDNFTVTHSFQVASALMAVPGVLKVSASPWNDGEPNCDSEEEFKQNLDELKEKAAKEVFLEKNAPKQESQQGSDKPTEQKDKPLVAPKPTLPNISKQAEKALDNLGEGEKAVKPQGNDSKGGTLIGGKLNSASGPLADPSAGDQFIQLRDGSKLDGLNPEMLRNFKMMAAEYGALTGKVIPVNSGVRSNSEQTALYKKDPSKAAKPGTSLHEHGLALDSDSVVLDELDKLGLMRKYGFTRPIGQEKWHMEAAGIQTNISRAKKDPSFASEVIANSLGKGGGGYGTIASAIKGRRDAEVALSLLKDTAPASKVTVTDKDKAQETLTPSPSIAKAETTPASAPSSASASTPETKTETAAVAKTPSATSIAQSNQANTSNGKGATFGETEPSSLAKSIQGGSSAETGDIRSIIADAAKTTGADPSILTAFAALESGLKPDARSGASSATGLFQFTSDTWKDLLSRHGRKHNLDASASPNDPKASSLLAGEFIKENMKSISGVTHNPTATDLYITHFLGKNGGRKFLAALASNPGADATALFQSAARSNPKIFSDNGRPRTLQEVYSFLQAKVQNTSRQYGISLPDTKMAAAPARTTASDSVPAASGESTGTQPSRTTTKTAQSSLPAPASSSGWPQPERTTNGGVNLPPSKPEARPQPVQSVFGAPKQGLPGIATSTQTASSEQGKSSNYSDLSKLNTIDSTLTKSLDVQTQTLEALKTFLSTVSPEKLTEATQKLTDSISQMGSQSQNTSKPNSGPATPVPKSAVSLRRVLA